MSESKVIGILIKPIIDCPNSILKSKSRSGDMLRTILSWTVKMVIVAMYSYALVL